MTPYIPPIPDSLPYQLAFLLRCKFSQRVKPFLPCCAYLIRLFSSQWRASMLPTISSANIFFEALSPRAGDTKMRKTWCQPSSRGQASGETQQSVTTCATGVDALKAWRRSPQCSLREVKKARNWCLSCKSWVLTDRKEFVQMSWGRCRRKTFPGRKIHRYKGPGV